MTRLLFVDDEPTIRLTLPKILEMHEFEVRAAANVQDALTLIQQEKFDVLLSDLNIGAPSDGFTVVSAMRRIQPDAITIIITGYPAFESALQAIREQVDDYISKPANVDDLVNTIKEKVRNRSHHALKAPVRVCDSLESHREAILQHYVAAVRKAKLPVEALSEQEIKDHVPQLLAETIVDLRHPSIKDSAEMTEVAAKHGRTRREQGFAVDDLVEEVRILRDTLYKSIQESLLEINTSELLPDLNRIGDFLLLSLRESVNGYLNQDGKPKTVKSVKAIKKAPRSKLRVRRAS